MESELRALSDQIASAISRRDTNTLRTLLAPGFVHRSHGGESTDAAGFLAAIEGISGEITFVRLERVHVDACPSGALVTGIQHAQVVIEREAIDDRRGFVDWFIRHEDGWRIQAAVDFALV